jgi:hypothetical protein
MQYLPLLNGNELNDRHAWRREYLAENGQVLVLLNMFLLSNVVFIFPNAFSV